MREAEGFFFWGLFFWFGGEGGRGFFFVGIFFFWWGGVGGDWIEFFFFWFVLFSWIEWGYYVVGIRWWRGWGCLGWSGDCGEKGIGERGGIEKKGRVVMDESLLIVAYECMARCVLAFWELGVRTCVCHADGMYVHGSTLAVHVLRIVLKVW